ncbi:putative phosphoenolpyruvate synthase [Araneus ventricosus]|uniref:Putative phosphoenolpyruvate synthase n=1 Tax=Araneus ventricosus TaxID=182803 RepID=A0A4Y2J4W2_ARAVE|nr:putative phosphoenolpyruvate synthase [Araneus ventricosus]GBM84272.1 putative phosphoenolpyruvate synthase [Araneus ventricosus]
MVLSLIVTLFTAPLEFLYWIKWVIAYVAIRIHNAFHGRRFDLYDVRVVNDPVKLGFLIPQEEKDLESPHPDSHLLEHADEVAFYGVNSKSECLLVRIARGCNQVADAWIYLKLANGKIYSLTETMGYQQSSDGNDHTFSCGKLQMHYLSPMRKWRIFYCGMLKQTSEDKHDHEEVVFVKFVFLWKASSDVYDCTLDTNPEGFADAMARSEWKVPFVPPIKKFTEALNFYAQTGVVMGTVSINDGPDYEIYLFGERMRSLGKSATIAGCKFTTILGSIPANGLSMHLSHASAPNMFKNAPFGFTVDPDGNLWNLKDLDINIKPFSVKRSGSSFQARFNAGEQYEIYGNISEPIVFYSGQGWSGFLDLSYIEFTYKNRRGSGLILTGEVYKEPKRPAKILPPKQPPTIVPLTVPFIDEASHFGEISGGKGSSLGMLTHMSKEEKSFIVPKGIIVTTAAYSEFLTPDILEAVKYLENIAYGNTRGDLIAACKKVSSIVEKTPLPKKICHSIIEDLKEVFKDEVNQKKFAVRSSATGEDTAAMSAAGQMDTFLGVQDLREIFSAVKKCWASQFGHIAVEYKRRYGQVLNSPMAVVIQEMVACEVSGVMFTCDPVTNNPSIITITANYGLGETVVSGSVEPDTFTVKRKETGKLEMESVILGSKHQRIVMQESGGTITEDLGEDSKNESCLSKETVIRLAKLGIKIEKYYKSSRDIEWGILNDKIYILQSRPVTNAAAITDEEIKREFDSPLRCENEYTTVANIGEVMPGALSPMAIEHTVKFFGGSMEKQALEKGFIDNFFKCKYFQPGILTFTNRMVLTVVELITRYGVNTPASNGFMISIFGRILDDPDLIDYAHEKVKEGIQQSWYFNLRYYWDLFFFDFTLPKIWKKVFDYHMGFMKHETAKETFDAMMNSCSDLDDAPRKHMECTENSSNWNMIMFSTLCKTKESVDNDIYSDFARFLATSSDVESANIPHAMQEVANQIVKDIGVEKFKSMSVEEAEEWLQTSSTLSGQKFRKFLARHGHRCLKEFDVYSVTWGMDPKLLIKSLQNLAGFGKEETKQEDESIDKIFSQLNVPLTFMSKLILRFVLPNCRRGVRARETSKSIVIKAMDQWRKGYRRLGKQMVSEGRLPEEDLLFFLTLEEVNELLKTRSPSIITRAIHRKRIYPTLDKYQFPEIMKGLPKPINYEEESSDNYEFVADLTMQGIPVSQGVTKGYARVAMTLDEAAYLKPGEILITYSTDIGWSPYFPIISGVVTELGGLISHGAVVSREYGLPCVVGLQGATKRFRTGDYVLLDGKKGILQRLPQPDE